jgi:hypothetical protein
MQAQQLIIGTYNIRYDNPRDTGNLWINRAPVVAALIRFHDFDIFGSIKLKRLPPNGDSLTVNSLI